MAEVTPVRARRGVLWLLLAWCAFFGASAHGYLENTDAVCTLHAARAWWLRGDPGLLREGPDTLPAERVLATLIAERAVGGMVGRDGRAYVWYPIGHQLLLVPCVAAGGVLARWFPEVERAAAARGDPAWEGLFFERLLASFLPALAAAGTATLLWLLARTLGCSAREAWLVMAATALATQLWPGASETTSDAPGMFFLTLCAWQVARWREGASARRCLVHAGVAGGLAVLLRYQHVVPVGMLALAAGIAAWPRPLGVLARFAAGAAPSAAFLLAANWLRFGDVTETGYSAGATPGTRLPLLIGLLCILAAPGKGVAWFSPPLWLAVAAAGRRLLRWPLAPFAFGLLGTVLLFAGRTFWSGGQCWGIRYLTATVALFVAVALAAGKPWRRWPRLTLGVVLLGIAVQLGGVLAPYRGHQELALAAAGVAYPDALPDPATGRGDTRENNVNWDPRFSPLHGHWVYAWLSASGRLERGGAENSTLPLFGVAVPPPARPSQPEDVAFRHWCLPYLGHALGFTAWPWQLLAWLLGAALLAVAYRATTAGESPGPAAPPRP